MNAQIEQVLSTIQSMDERSQMEVAERIVIDLAAHSSNLHLWLDQVDRRIAAYAPPAYVDLEDLRRNARKRIAERSTIH